MTKYKYVEISEQDVPEGVSFDVLRADQGQTVELAWGGFGAAEHGPGDEYKRINDRSEHPDYAVRYYRRVAK
jgi:hypothetical protein